MSYTPTNWQTGDTITAERLNNMESGITQTLVIHAKFNEQWGLISVDCPAADALAAINAGKNVEVIFERYSGNYITETRKAVRAPFISNPGVNEEFFVVGSTTDVPIPYVLQLSLQDGWATNGGVIAYPNASFELGYSPDAAQGGSYCGNVFGFNHMDPTPYWREVNRVIPMGAALDPVIAGAMQAATAAGGKATLTTALASAEAGLITEALAGWFLTLKGGLTVLQMSGNYYEGSVALTTRAHTQTNSEEYTDMQTGTFQVPMLSGSGGAYSIDTLWNFTLSIYTKRQYVSDELVNSANLALTAEEITPMSVS